MIAAAAPLARICSAAADLGSVATLAPVVPVTEAEDRSQRGKVLNDRRGQA